MSVPSPAPQAGNSKPKSVGADPRLGTSKTTVLSSIGVISDPAHQGSKNASSTVRFSSIVTATSVAWHSCGKWLTASGRNHDIMTTNAVFLGYGNEWKSFKDNAHRGRRLHGGNETARYRRIQLHPMIETIERCRQDRCTRRIGVGTSRPRHSQCATKYVTRPRR